MKTILHAAKHTLKNASIPSYSLDAELLLAHSLGVAREQILLSYDRVLSSLQEQQFSALLARRLAREPMAQILGKREFWGREFKVTKDTLDPRPDSETLIETVLSHYRHRDPPKKILDLGTGTGCLLLTLLAEFPGAKGVGIDINKASLEVAKSNAMHLGLEKHVEFLLQYWAEGVTDTFDMVISNPPYIRDGDIIRLEPEVSNYEPYVALAGGEDGLRCYRELVPQLSGLMNADGIAVLEMGIGQAEDVSGLIRSNRLQVKSITRDLAGVERCISAVKCNKTT